MAKPIILNWNGTDNAFAFSKLDRTKLYGYKTRQLVDEAGENCLSAYLTGDGSAIVPSGGLAQVYVNDDYATIERADLKAIDDEGNELKKKPSTLGVAQELTGPVSPQEVLDYTITSVYQLDPETVSDELLSALSSGQIFASEFSYRGDYELQKLFLLQNESGQNFALIAAASNFEFLHREVVPDLDIEEDDDLSDDFDFSMM